MQDKDLIYKISSIRACETVWGTKFHFLTPKPRGPSQCNLQQGEGGWEQTILFRC